MDKISLRDFQRLKVNVETQQNRVARAEGVIERILGQLESEYDCATLEEAVEKSKILKRKCKLLEQELREKWDKFKGKFGNYLEGNDGSSD